MNSLIVRNATRALKVLVVASILHVHANEDAAISIYKGTVSAVQFENDGSFLIQLNPASQKTTTHAVKCKNQTTFLVQKNYQGLTPRDLKRMRQDVREAFFSEKNPSISLKVYGCEKDKDLPLVSNVILGSWQDNN